VAETSIVPFSAARCSIRGHLSQRVFKDLEFLSMIPPLPSHADHFTPVSFPKSAAVGLFQPTGRRGKLHRGINGEYKRGKKEGERHGGEEAGAFERKDSLLERMRACSLKKLSPQASGAKKQLTGNWLGP